MSVSLPGVPDGYEAVGYDRLQEGMVYLDSCGNTQVYLERLPSGGKYLIVTPVKPATETVRIGEWLVRCRGLRWTLVRSTEEQFLEFYRPPKWITHQIGDFREAEVPVITEKP